MASGSVIQTSKSADLVTQKVIVDGEELSKKYQVKTITIDKEVNRIATARLILVDGDPSKQDFEISNEALLIPGALIEITAGYHSDEETIFKGIIIKHNIKVRSNGSYLIIECRDETVKLTIGRKNKYFYESKDSAIIEEIIDNYSIDKTVEETNYEHKELVQYNCSDWDFIITRAQANGKLCFVDDGTITIKKPDFDTEAIETVTFGATMLDLDAEIDARNQYDTITSYSWNYADQEIVTAEGEDPQISLNGNLQASDLASVIQAENLELKHGGTLSTEELQDWSDAKRLFQQLSKVRGRVKFQGIPAVKPGIILNLQGVGDRYNGKVYITGIKHHIAEGNWTIDAQFGINPNWFSETYDINPLPASGLLSGVCGLQIGIVSQLEEDPDGENRILVQLPIVNDQEQGIWCRVASLDAGENRGAFFLPEIKDEVIVGFINDDPNDAVVLGMLNSSAKPAPITATDDNHEKGFITRSEMKILFDDDKKSLTIETPAGKKMVLDEDAGSITIEDDNSNIIVIDDAGVSIESASDINLKASGDINLEGTNVNLKATSQFKAEGSSGVEMSSSATAVLKGSLVQIN